MERLQSFTQGKYDLTNNSMDAVEANYMQQLTDASERLEALTIRKGAMPTARILASNRSASGSSSSGKLGGGLAAGAPSRTGTLLNRQSSVSSPAAAPPAYTPSPAGSTVGSTGVAGKRPPPPPPVKPKPAFSAPKNYVVALYDYTATVSSRRWGGSPLRQMHRILTLWRCI